MSSPALLSQPIGRLDGTPAALGDLTGERATLLVNVTFPMTEKVEVNGAGRHPVYVDLVQVPDQSGRVGDVQWNFEKFLLDGNGAVVARFDPTVVPDDPAVTAAIEAVLH